MKLKELKIENHELVYDGDEDGYYNAIIIESLKITDFISLFKLNEVLDETEISSLLTRIEGYQIHPFKTYKSKNDDLMLKFHRKNESTHDLLFIVSSGESQPGRYKIFLEGVWAIHPD